MALSANERKVITALLGMSNPKSRTLTAVCAAAGLSRVTGGNALHRLEDAGHLKSEWLDPMGPSPRQRYYNFNRRKLEHLLAQ